NSCGRGKLPLELRRGDEFDVLLSKVEARLQVRQQVQQLLPERSQRPGQSARELRERRIQPTTIFGIDDAQHGFGLRQIEPSSQKCPQRKFSAARQSSAALANCLQRRL